MLLTLLLAATAPLLPQERTPLKAQPTPAESGLRVRFVDDLGAPLADRPISVCKTRSTPNSSSSRGLRGSPTVTDTDGAALIPPQPPLGDWKLGIKFEESDLRGHADTNDRFELEWDGRSGFREVVIPRTGSIKAEIKAPTQLAHVDFSVTGATSSWYSDGMSGLGPVNPTMPVSVDSTGGIRVDGLTPGSWDITVRSGVAAVTTPIEVRSGAVSDVGKIELTSGMWIRGRLDPSVGADSVDAFQASFRMRNGWTSGQVQEDGSFGLGGLAEGLHEVQLHHAVPEPSWLDDEGNPVVWLIPFARRFLWSDGASLQPIDFGELAPARDIELSVRCMGARDPSTLSVQVLRREEGRDLEHVSSYRARHVSEGIFRAAIAGNGTLEVTIRPMPGTPPLNVDQVRIQTSGPELESVSVLTDPELAPPRNNARIDAPTRARLCESPASAGRVDIQPLAQGRPAPLRVQLFDEEERQHQCEEPSRWYLGSTAPAVYDHLPAGTYTVRIHGTFERQITVAAGETLKLNLDVDPLD